MAENWSEGTRPAGPQNIQIQESLPQDAASPAAEVTTSVIGAVHGDEASRRFLLRVVQPGLA
nr:hypothetical protein [Chloroflexota bacterium]